MKLIIDIPEETYDIIKNINDFYNMSRTAVRIEKQEIGLAIKNGTPLSEELEKIKAEIDEIVESEMKEDVLWSLGLRYSKKIIDKHITELKGEQQ